MCMQGTNDGCILLERTAKVEERMAKVEERMAKVEAKLWVLIGLVAILVGVLSLITFKLLDSQIYLLSGEQGLHAVSDEARGDIQAVRKVVR